MGDSAKKLFSFWAWIYSLIKQEAGSRWLLSFFSVPQSGANWVCLQLEEVWVPRPTLVL